MNNATHTTSLTPLSRLKALVIAAAVACLLLAAAASRADASFGIAAFDGEVLTAAGEPATQAGSHPYAANTVIEFNSHLDESMLPLPDGSFKDLVTDLPPGLIGDPSAVPKCSTEDFQAGLEIFDIGVCEDNAAVGVARIQSGVFGELWAPVYNLKPEPNQPARFGFHILTASIYLNPSVRTGGDYGLSFEIQNSSQALPVTMTSLTFWGVPADPSHDLERGKCVTAFGPSGSECPVNIPAKPFLTNPTSCEGPVLTSLRVNSWQDQADWSEASFLSHDTSHQPIGADGCEKLPFAPTVHVQAQPGSAASPSSLSVKVHIPQSTGPGQNATAHLKKAVVTLPAGVTVNAAAANGLGACTPAQIGLANGDSPSCPNSSKVGSVEIETPLLERPLTGAVYLAQQHQNPFGSLLAVYLVAEGSGVVVKLPGKVDVDPSTGQVTATFDDNPQLPFEDLAVRFFGGSGAALVAPSSCGSYETRATFTPWSGTAPVTDTDTFAIGTGPNGGPCPSGGFEPGFSAGSTSPTAGGHSPFVLSVSREDGAQALGSIEAKLPKGLLARLKGIPYCPDAALASIPTAAGSGAAQIAAPSCPAASQIGAVRVGAGAGGNPVYVNTGRAYLAGPYKGAPLSVAFVTPAVAGPFDLGNVVIRAALKVDPVSAQVTAVSDPIPTILHGIPLNLREVRVDLDRSGFMVNPTSCEKKSVDGTIVSAAGVSAAVSDRFQVGSCAGLGFSPKLSLRVKGGTKRNAYPKLRSVLTVKKGQANIGRVSVALPHSEFLAQNHINTVCTRVQFAADACPKGSIYGYAKAFSPLLDKPLKGPVYLRSSNNPLPDLVAALHGQIEIDLAGRIDSVNGGIRTRFEMVPDAPITKFVLEMKGGKKGLLVNSRNLCASVNRATVKLDGQNGKIHDSRPVLANSCGKAK